MVFEITDTKFTDTIVSVIIDIYVQKAEISAFTCHFWHFYPSVTNQSVSKGVFWRSAW